MQGDGAALVKPQRPVLVFTRLALARLGERFGSCSVKLQLLIEDELVADRFQIVDFNPDAVTLGLGAMGQWVRIVVALRHRGETVVITVLPNSQQREVA